MAQSYSLCGGRRRECVLLKTWDRLGCSGGSLVWSGGSEGVRDVIPGVIADLRQLEWQ